MFTKCFLCLWKLSRLVGWVNVTETKMLGKLNTEWNIVVISSNKRNITNPWNVEVRNQTYVSSVNLFCYIHGNIFKYMSHLHQTNWVLFYPQLLLCLSPSLYACEKTSGRAIEWHLNASLSEPAPTGFRSAIWCGVSIYRAS